MTDKKGESLLPGNPFGNNLLFGSVDNKNPPAGFTSISSLFPPGTSLFGNNSSPTFPGGSKAESIKPPEPKQPAQSTFMGFGQPIFNAASSKSDNLFGKTSPSKTNPEQEKLPYPSFGLGGSGSSLFGSSGKKEAKEDEKEDMFSATKKSISIDVEMKTQPPMEEKKSLLRTTNVDASKKLLITSNLDLVKMTAEGIKSEPLLPHNEEDYEITQAFYKHFTELQNQLKAWLENESTRETKSCSEFILAGCDEYLKILYNISTKPQNRSLHTALSEMEMMLLGLIVIHMRPKETVNSEKVSKLVQCHAQSNKYWDEYMKLKENSKKEVQFGRKDDYKSLIVEEGEKYLLEGLCTGNYVECQKALELGKEFPKGNNRVVQLENLVKDLYGRNLTLQDKNSYKVMNEEDYKQSFSLQKDKAKQILKGFKIVPEHNKKLQKILEQALLIIQGDDEVIKKTCTTCFQYIYCYLVYQKPDPTLRQLETLCEVVKEKYRIRKGSFEYKMIEMLVASNSFDVLSSFYGDYPPWFGIHCMDAYNLYLKGNGRLLEPMDEEDLPELQFAVSVYC